jgi:two-component sensor histidine kinase/PAS domain-containing protein
MASVINMPVSRTSWPPSGLSTVPHLEWGSHLAHFFSSAEEIRDVMVPYFRAGLENNERCLWVVASEDDAKFSRTALRNQVPDLDQRERDGQIEIASADKWYSAADKLRPRDLVDDLIQREREALANGYAGLRTNGNSEWVSAQQWEDFLDYEALVHEAARGRRMICLCSYSMDQLHDDAQFDVMERHHMTIPTTARSRSGVRVRNRRTNFDLAMTASKMGTWRYTIADNICVYDENAQRLYGLTEARFLHDEEGVKAKFHPDDMDLMWSRVVKALDPKGDGKYDVEYRVKQRDGSWRWLSAWGLVEFEGEGSDRKPVAITGASRDLTELKAAEEQQKLLFNELNHRMKNTLATVQAVSGLTLKSASDLPSAKQALEQRIVSMAKAHDLLRSREWTSASLGDVVERALEAFASSRIRVEGPDVEVSPRQVLALSMALHELGTNAVKYGALSTSEGQISLRWRVSDGRLHFEWKESDGPRVVIPQRKGFGSLLLERLLVRDLGGDIDLSYEPTGLRFRMAAPL